MRSGNQAPHAELVSTVSDGLNTSTGTLLASAVMKKQYKTSTIRYRAPARRTYTRLRPEGAEGTAVAARRGCVRSQQTCMMQSASCGHVLSLRAVWTRSLPTRAYELHAERAGLQTLVLRDPSRHADIAQLVQALNVLQRSAA